MKSSKWLIIKKRRIIYILYYNSLSALVLEFLIFCNQLIVSFVFIKISWSFDLFNGEGLIKEIIDNKFLHINMICVEQSVRLIPKV